MTIVSTTLCYPRPSNPTQGIFVQRRLEEIARVMPLRVVVPVPWFPFVRPVRLDPIPQGESPTATYERMLYLPGLLKSQDARHYCRTLMRGIGALKAGSEPIGLIDAHFEWPDGVGAFYAARRLGLPFVCTLRGKLVSQIESSAKRRRIREMLIGADALISVSSALADLAREVAGRDLSVRVIPNGVDSEIFNYRADHAAIRAELNWSSEARYVLSVGHLQELKGFHHLVAMWPKVRRRAGDVRLILVGGPAGEPAYEQRLNAMIQDAELAGSISLAGRQKPDRIAAMLNAADLFVLASRSEGWCNAIAESLACGCPVVATEVGGNSEVMNHWGLGRLVPYGQWDAFADRIVTSLEEPWERAKIAEFGGRRSWRQVAAECAEVLTGVLQSRP